VELHLTATGCHFYMGSGLLIRLGLRLGTGIADLNDHLTYLRLLSTKLASLDRQAQLTRCFSAVAELLLVCNAVACRLLIEAGADVNACDHDGWTPLHAAAHWGQDDACKLLADHLANVSAIDHVVHRDSCCSYSAIEWEQTDVID